MDVNEDSVNRVIAAIQNEANHFNMATHTDIIHGFRTPACISAWAASIALDGICGLSYDSDQIATEFLGGDNASLESFVDLFYPPLVNYEYELITRAEAIKTLEILRDTGEIDWSHVPEDRSLGL